jgi:gas vesicle protein
MKRHIMKFLIGAGIGAAVGLVINLFSTYTGSG